jgi:hypothetical protein
MSQIQAATIERDEGYWTHPDFPEWDEGTKKAEFERFYDDSDSDISDWSPVYEKAGSFLLSIHDTEDGPVALFFAPKDKDTDA